MDQRGTCDTLISGSHSSKASIGCGRDIRWGRGQEKAGVHTRFHALGCTWGPIRCRVRPAAKTVFSEETDLPTPLMLPCEWLVPGKQTPWKLLWDPRPWLCPHLLPGARVFQKDNSHLPGGRGPLCSRATGVEEATYMGPLCGTQLQPLFSPWGWGSRQQGQKTH